MVQAQRTSSNLLEPHHHRDSKVWSVLPHEFGVVRLYRTFSLPNYIVTRETRCAGCFCTSSGWFKQLLEPQQHRDSKVWRVLLRAGWIGVVQETAAHILSGLIRAHGKGGFWYTPTFVFPYRCGGRTEGKCGWL